jgi:Spy/CpxP family protein refolding chaperone
MKHNWLLYLVIFSLALNLGTVGTLLYLHFQGPPPRPAGPPPMPVRELWGSLNLDPQQQQSLVRLFPEHQRQVLAARTALAQRRGELMALMQQENPPWEALRGKVQEISNLQGQLEEEMVRYMLEMKKQLKPEQRQAFLNMMQTRLERGGPAGRRGGPPGRWDIGPGMGKGPAMGPGPWPRGIPGTPPPPPGAE